MMLRTLAVVLGLALLLPAPATAHQQLLSARPASGAALTRAPGEVRLTFNQAVEPALASLRLTGPHGEVALGSLRVAPNAPKVLLAPITGPLTAGSYTVAWLVTGADGHPVRGEYSFTIEAGAEGLAPEAAPAAGGTSDPGSAAADEAAPSSAHHSAGAGETTFDAESPLYAAVRWLTFTGLLVVIGAVSFAFLLLGSLRRREPAVEGEALTRARTRAASVGVMAAGLLLVAVLLRLYAQSVALHGPGGALAAERVGLMLTRTTWGWGWMLQAGAALAALLGLWLARGGRGAGWPLAALAALVLAVTPALSGHAVAASPLAVVADALHVLAAGGWLGTLLLMVVAGLPALLREGGSRTATAASLLGAFSPLALSFAGLLTFTGVYAAWIHLPSVSALWSSDYGRTLLLKLAVLSVVFATGAYNWLRVKPAVERSGNVRPLKRSAAAELATGIVVLLVTAVLVATPPPAEQQAVAVEGGSGPPRPTVQ